MVSLITFNHFNTVASPEERIGATPNEETEQRESVWRASRFAMELRLIYFRLSRISSIKIVICLCLLSFFVSMMKQSYGYRWVFPEIAVQMIWDFCYHVQDGLWTMV